MKDLTLTDRRVDEQVAILNQYSLELSKSKEKSRDFLVRAGILTSKGKLAKPYKHLCIPPEQASS